MKPNTILSLILPSFALATGVFQGVCLMEGGDVQAVTDYRVTKDCCAAIGGGSHFFNELQCSCQSTGGAAFHRVWKEALEKCCVSRDRVPQTCNQLDCGQGMGCRRNKMFKA